MYHWSFLHLSTGKCCHQETLISEFSIFAMRNEGDRPSLLRETSITEKNKQKLRVVLLFMEFLIYVTRHVFNYDFPRNMEEYVHRVGRTGRAG